MATGVEHKSVAHEWAILGQLVHRGVTYGRGEPVPSMTHDEALAYEASGMLVRAGSEPVVRSRPEPQDIETYFQANDEMFLLRLIEHRPLLPTLTAMEEYAEKTGRSRVLVAAIRTIAAYVETHNHESQPKPKLRRRRSAVPASE